jgi:hypothetical protein
MSYTTQILRYIQQNAYKDKIPLDLEVDSNACDKTIRSNKFNVCVEILKAADILIVDGNSLGTWSSRLVGIIGIMGECPAERWIKGSAHVSDQ